jgi:hypothetical protein
MKILQAIFTDATLLVGAAIVLASLCPVRPWEGWFAA